MNVDVISLKTSETMKYTIANYSIYLNFTERNDFMVYTFVDCAHTLNLCTINLAFLFKKKTHLNRLAGRYRVVFI